MATDANNDAGGRRAAAIEDIAREMRSLAKTKLSGAADGIGACWEGEAAKAFLRHTDETIERILAGAEALEALAVTMRGGSGRT